MQQTFTQFVSFGWGPLAVGCNTYISCLGNTVIDIINLVLVPLLFAVAFITFLYGVAKTYIISVGNEEEVRKGHKLILWGLVGFAVMLSVWGLVNVVTYTFGLQGYAAPSYPNSYTGALR